MKKTLLLLLSLGLIAGSAVACGGSGVADEVGTVGIVPLPDYIEPDNELLNVDDGAELDDGSDITFDADDIVLPGESGGGNFDTSIAAYFPITGEIISIEIVSGVTHIRINDTDGNEAVLALSEDIVFPFSNNFQVGDTVTGWYLTNAPIAMIWPPQYNISVLVAGAPDGVNIKVDMFHVWEDNTEDYFISQDGMFAFRIDENTEIILEDGIEFLGDDLNNRRLIVIYGISTRSIPEMTTADRIIVFYEGIMALG